MAHTTLVNVDIETALKLSSFLSSLKGEREKEREKDKEREKEREVFYSECEKLVKENKTVELISLFLSLTDTILGIENQRDAEGCFEAIVSILYTVPDPQSVLGILSLSLEKLTSNSVDQTALRLRILVNIFNLLTSVEGKFMFLKGIFTYALQTNQSKLVNHFSGLVTRWLDQWEIDIVNQREIFLLLSRLLQDKPSSSSEYLLKYLDSFTGDELSSFSEGVEIATKAVVDSIRSSLVSHSYRWKLYKLLSKQTISNSSLQSLIQLLAIICEGNLEGFSAFNSIESNVTVMNTNEITAEQIFHTLKLLKLCTLISKMKLNENNVLSYEVISSTLSITEDEVEDWVVEAITNQLLEASMDQLKKVIIISRCVRLSFDIDQWQSLLDKVNGWKQSVETMNELLKKRNE